MPAKNFFDLSGFGLVLGAMAMLVLPPVVVLLGLPGAATNPGPFSSSTSLKSSYKYFNGFEVKKKDSPEESAKLLGS